MVNIQITGGAFIIGATLFCCLCLFVALLIIISIIFALMYISGCVVDVQIIINLQLPEAHIETLRTIFQNVNVVKEKARKLKANKLMDRDKTSVKSALVDFNKHRPNETIEPLILRISNFTNKLNSNQQYYSKPFIAYEGGHKMCLRVDTGGKGTHVSVYLQDPTHIIIYSKPIGSFVS